MVWTEEQVRALVPDAGTLKRGLELARPAPWQNLGTTSRAVWGECAGSGARPYQTAVDLGEPAFKCSCPSRVFPCKHGVGLLLLLAREPQRFGPLPEPEWLTEWLSKRQTRQTPAKAENVAPPVDETDNAARQKRESQRLERMQLGAQELERWLTDIVSQGLAQLDRAPASFWEQQAARLVDAQLPGLAATVREVAGLRYTGPQWPERLLGRLGELYLLTQAFGRLDQLPASRRADVLQLVGVNVKKEDVLGRQPAVADTWLVVGLVTTEEERLLVRRAWLWGISTGRYALVLEYSFGGQAFATPLLPFGTYRGGLAFYPGTLPLRAAAAADWEYCGLRGDILPPGLAPAELLDGYARALGQQPWLRQWPATVAGVVPVLLPNGDLQLLHPASGQALPLHPDSQLGWGLLAASGGYPITVFGEWDGQVLLPISFTSAAAPVSAGI
ncbi:SWIM zinc finger family protein [Hymenobacter chitinivorans]|uniref:SWIM-type domain-containing protein n=1 Tax=Hymenobacter chitinivorans DSM 11115 TaxID=1121954 RepID=A0A2M9BRA6_9BACT|nr:hypothetical protein [Hymenobacter chitinivorans]PJJ60477.1 hypothetical protein CLV45_1905 [Hymenobacter chitinivorans DSM 11115]